MSRVFVVMICIAVGGFGLGCGAGSTESEDVVSAVTAEPVVEDTIEDAVQALDLVVVESDGAEFDPPVQPEQIPDGAWYCDMGTVHYASLERGEGKCSLCGMDLVQKAPEGAPSGEG